jgi:putative transposase
MPKEPSRGPRNDQRWSTFLCNHAGAILACDFFVVVTVTFRSIYVFVILEHGSRRILHCNATSHPTSEWTMQQLRQAIPSDHMYRFVIHDRGSVFSKELDVFLENIELRVLRTPYRSPKANSICERAIGSMRRECLDHMIPLTENHLRRVLKGWVFYYNQTRPHLALGPRVPEPKNTPVPLQWHRHRIGNGQKVVSRPVLNGLHHEYCLIPLAA